MRPSSKKGRAGGAEGAGPRLKLVTGAPAPLPAGVPQYLTINEVASMLRCRPSTIYQMVHKKRIPFRKAGRQLLFEVGEIDAWTKAGADKQ